jgi:DNA-binding beta-propeller fold protein YncE
MNPKHSIYLLISLFLLTSSLVGCGESGFGGAGDSAAKASAGSENRDGAAGGWGGEYEPGPAADAGASYQDVSAPDEPYVEVPEEEFAFHSSAVGAEHVFIVDKNRDQVVFVDALSLKIRAVKVGDAPVLVKAFPGQDAVVVLNEGSNTVSLVRVDAEHQAAVSHFEVLPGANTVEVSPFGDYAVIYYQHQEGGTNLGTLNAVDVLRITEGDEAIVEVSTGFRPSGVTFSEDGARLFVVSQAGLTRVRLPEDVDTPGFSAPLPLVDDTLLNQLDREVLVTADGAFAVTRIIGEDKLSVLDIDAKVAVDFSLGERFPSDIDLVPGTHEAIVTYRDAGQIERIDLDSLVDESTPLDEAIDTLDTDALTLGLCRVSDDGAVALFYSTQSEHRVMARLSLTQGNAKLKPIPMSKTVRIVEIDPSSRFGVVYHTKEPGTPSPTDDFETIIAKSHGYSVLDIASSYVQPFITDHEPQDLVFLPEHGRMFVLLPDPGNVQHMVEEVDFARFLATSHTLFARPLSIQAFQGDPRAVVLEEHLSGRLTFIDSDSGEVESVTGFQLNAE